ncbi:MAG: hypothetical protein AB1758_27375 [Candidatus Eremiobacterota bacterium]
MVISPGMPPLRTPFRLSRPLVAAASGGPAPVELGPLPSMALKAGVAVAQLGPWRCAAIGLALGLLGSLIAVDAPGAATAPLVLAGLGGWMGYDARQSVKAFQAGPDSELWRKRSQDHSGVTPARMGANTLNSMASMAGGLTGLLLTGDVVGGTLCSAVAFFLTHRPLERAGAAAERALVERYYPQA